MMLASPLARLGDSDDAYWSTICLASFAPGAFGVAVSLVR